MLTNNVTFSERVKSVSIKAPPHTQRGWCHTWKHTLALIIDTGGCSLSVRAVEKLNHIGSDAASKPSASSGSETDNVRWAVQCNWSVDYYQPCVCQIKTPLKYTQSARVERPQALLDFLLQQLNIRQNVSHLQRGTGLCTCKNEGEDLSSPENKSDSHQWKNRGNKELINRIYYMLTKVNLLHNPAHSEILLVKNPAPINCIWKTKHVLACLWKCFILNILFFFQSIYWFTQKYGYIFFLTITLHYFIINYYIIQILQLHFMLTLFWVRIS